MSNFSIKDGTGRGTSAEVTESYKLMTLSVTEAISAHHAFEETAFNINTGNITLTSANASSVLYLKNNDDADMVIESFIYNLGSSTGGSGFTQVQVERNPTSGTVISGGTSFDAVNRNFGSAKTLTATSKKGAEGSTSSGGTVCLDSIFPSAGRNVISVGAIILPRGASLAVKVTPPTSNTSQTIQIAVSLYMVQEQTRERTN